MKLSQRVRKPLPLLQVLENVDAHVEGLLNGIEYSLENPAKFPSVDSQGQPVPRSALRQQLKEARALRLAVLQWITVLS